MKTLAMAIIAIVLSLGLASHAFAKPQPPANLEKIFVDFNALEAKFEKGQWAEVDKALTAVDNAFKRLLPELEKTVERKYVQDYFAVTGELKKAFEAKNDETASRAYIRLQLLFLEIMSAYEYKTHPVISIMVSYIGEGEEAAAKSDWKEAAGEAKEVLSFTRLASKVLTNAGAGKEDVSNLTELGKKLSDAGQSKDLAAYRKNAGELKKLLAKYSR